MRFLSTLVASVLGTLIALGALFLLGFFFLFALSLSSDPTPTVATGTVLKVTLEGNIPERTPDDPLLQAFSDGPAYDLLDLRSALTKAAVDDRIEGVWLDIKGTAAPWATLEEVRASLAAVRDSGKTVYASSADFGMSEAEYFVASAADSVFASPIAPFLLNGFQLQQIFFKDGLDRLGIEPQIVRVGEYKGAVEPLTRTGLSEENREQLQLIVENQSRLFVEAVAAARGLDANAFARLMNEEGILTAERAVDEGLLDGLLYPEEVRGLFTGDDGSESGGGFGADLTTIDVATYARVPAEDAGLDASGDGSLAIVYAGGAIQSGKSDGDELEFGNAEVIGSTTFIEAMEQATESDAAALVLRIDSPGGSAPASEVMWNAVRRATEVKPVIVSMGGQAASGGYYIAAAADTIVANAQTITGSIGVFGTLFDASDFFNDELGVTFDAVQTSELADLGSVAEPLGQAERRLLEQSIEQTYDTFVARVAEGRGLSDDSVRVLAQGRVYTGTEAQDVGLVDELGGLREALQLAGRRAGLGDGPYRVQIYPRPLTFAERLNKALTGQSARLWTRLTTSEFERAFVQQRATLRRLVRDHGTIQARLPVELTVR
jgi:protease-4